MPQAWMKRDSERQQFVQGWRDKFLREFEEKNFLPQVGESEEKNRLCLYSFLHSRFVGLRVRKDWIPQKPSDEERFLYPVWNIPSQILYIYNDLEDSIKNFSRTPEEEQHMIAAFLDFFNEQIGFIYRRDLQRQQIMEPEKVYDGHGATDDVPFEESN